MAKDWREKIMSIDNENNQFVVITWKCKNCGYLNQSTVREVDDHYVKCSSCQHRNDVEVSIEVDDVDSW
jgi:predicted Zn-ribbon and HTH transcriptional regulator